MIGIDVVDVERFRGVLDRAPGFATRYFTPAERDYCGSRDDAAVHLAGRLAAKEAVMKALDLTPAPAWARRIEVIRAPSGRIHTRVGDRDIAVSISHDGGTAVAVALTS